MAERISLRKVAEVASVSRTTVSLALRQDPSIPCTTRSRIQKIAQELGYSHNQYLSQTMSHIRRVSSHGEVVGFVQARSRGAFHRPVQQALRGFRQQLEMQGYHLQPLQQGKDFDDSASLNRILETRNYRGVFTPSFEAQTLFADVDLTKLAMVVFGPSPAPSNKPHRVVADLRHALMEGITQLRKRGSQKLGLVLVRNDDSLFGVGAEVIWRSITLYVPGDAAPELLVMDEWDPEAFLKWFAEHRPDCLLASRGCPAQVLLEDGVEVPGDVQVAQIDLPDPESISCSGINLHHEQHGTMAANFLISLLSSNNLGIPQYAYRISVDPEWVDHGTTRPDPNGSAASVLTAQGAGASLT